MRSPGCRRISHTRTLSFSERSRDPTQRIGVIALAFEFLGDIFRPGGVVGLERRFFHHGQCHRGSSSTICVSEYNRFEDIANAASKAGKRERGPRHHHRWLDERAVRGAACCVPPAGRSIFTKKVVGELSGRGAGIVAQPEILDGPARRSVLRRAISALRSRSGGCSIHPGALVLETDCPQVMTAWERVYRILRDALPGAALSSGPDRCATIEQIGG